MPSGGKREGAGRKRTRDKYEAPVNAAEQQIADKLPKIIGNLFKLANGGYKREKEKYERIIKRNDNGDPILKNGQVQYEFVLVERTIEVAEPDRNANIYLIDRILGKPMQGHELEDGDGDTVPFAIVRLPVKVTPEEWQQAAQQHAQNAAVQAAKAKAPAPADKSANSPSSGA